MADVKMTAVASSSTFWPFRRSPRSTDRLAHAVPRFIIAITITFGMSSAYAATWAEKLGYPPGEKVVILHAHGMGLCHATNRAAQQMHESGMRCSMSVMAPCPWFQDFVQWAREHPKKDVGLEMTINSELPRYRWQPVAPDSLVRSLVDVDGYLWPATIQSMVNATASEVELELRHQIERSRRSGLQPTHLATHIGTLFTRLDLAEVYLRMAQEYWIPAVVIEITPDHIDRFRRMGYPLPAELVDLIARYPLPKIDDLQIVGVAEQYEQKRQQLVSMFQGLKPGLTQIDLLPAIESDALARIDPQAQQRVWDARLIGDEVIRNTMEAEGIRLTDWREIMERFSGLAPRSNPTDQSASEDSSVATKQESGTTVAP